METGETHSLELSSADLMTLRAGLRAYLREFARHRELDGGATHPEEEWQQVQRQVGELIWRLEEAGVSPDTMIVHSEEAVKPWHQGS
jgi:hypothetical protein